MTFLDDKAVERLRRGELEPDLSGTRYRLLERIARGGMGVVYTAEDQQLRRRVALKVLDFAEEDGELSRRLLQEARVLAQLEHPGIVPVHDAGTLADGRVFYAMKFVEGQRLDEYLAGAHSLPDRLRVFLRICEAVAFAHTRGVLHRDLKPANVMLGPFGEVLVMDWGLAKVLKRDEDELGAKTTAEMKKSAGGNSNETRSPVDTDHGTRMGTPGFMAPEQARGDVGAVDGRSDVFSLGAMLQFLANAPGETGRRNAPKPLRAIWEKAMAVEPAKRYGSVTEMAEDVSRQLDGLPVSAYREGFLEKLARFYQRHQVAILLIAAYLFMRMLLLLLAHR